jgi:hypothetical protein
MDRVNSRISQAYGYAVCLITVIVMLIGIKQVVDAAFDLSDPIRADGGGYGRMGRPLTNFELYKMEARRQGPTRNDPTAPAEKAAPDSTTSDADLRRIFDAEREAAIGNARFRAIRSLVGNLLLITVAGVLFTIHWRWLRARDSVPVTG